jgi:hypothetical protein
MTPLTLQDLLVTKINVLFTGKQLLNEKGEKANFTVCSQYLPSIDPTVASRTNLTYFPFIRVILDEGEDPDIENPNKCYTRTEIGVYDPDTTYQGHRDLTNVIDRIYRHFMAKKFLDVFELEYPFRWSLNPENTYPKFYGMIEMVWNLPKVTITDILS